MLRVAGDGSVGLDMSPCEGGYYVDALINNSNSEKVTVPNFFAVFKKTRLALILTAR